MVAEKGINARRSESTKDMEMLFSLIMIMMVWIWPNDILVIMMIVTLHDAKHKEMLV